MRRATATFLLLVTLLVAHASTVAAAPAVPGRQPSAVADHIAGDLTLCGPLVTFRPPRSAADGLLRIAAIDPHEHNEPPAGPHPFVIAAGTAIGPMTQRWLRMLATWDSYTCLAVHANQTGHLTAVAIDREAEVCGPWFTTPAGDYGVSNREFFDDDDPRNDLTTTLINEAAALVDADPALELLLRVAADGGGGGGLCVTLTTSHSGRLTGLALDGPLFYCDAVIDTVHNPASPSRLFDYVAGQPVPQATVGIGPIVYDTESFSTAGIALMELLIHSGGGVCVVLSIESTSIVSVELPFAEPDTPFPQNTAHLCGELSILDGNIGLIPTNEFDPTYRPFALLHHAIIGFDVEPLDEAHNALRLMSWGSTPPRDRLCIDASVAGTASDPVVMGHADQTSCATVTELTDETITILRAHASATLTLELVPGSYVDQRAVTEPPAGLSITAGFGADALIPVDGAVVIGYVGYWPC